MPYKYFFQTGGVKCSICGANGVNKASHFTKDGKVNTAKGHKKAVKMAKKAKKKVKAKCQPIKKGLDIMNQLSLGIGSETKMSEVEFITKDDDFAPLTKEMLNSPISMCPEIIVRMPFSTGKELKIEEETGQFVFPRTVKAGDGHTVRVQDVLKEWIANNRRIKKLEDKIRPEVEKEGRQFYGFFGDHVYYEGFKHLKDNIYAMEDYGS